MNQKQIDKLINDTSPATLDLIVRTYFEIEGFAPLKDEAKMCFIVLIKHVRNCFKPYITEAEIAEKLRITRSAVNIAYSDYKKNPIRYRPHLEKLLAQIYL